MRMFETRACKESRLRRGVYYYNLLKLICYLGPPPLIEDRRAAEIAEKVFSQNK